MARALAAHHQKQQKYQPHSQQPTKPQQQRQSGGDADGFEAMQGDEPVEYLDLAPLEGVTPVSGDNVASVESSFVFDVETALSPQSQPPRHHVMWIRGRLARFKVCGRQHP